MVVPHVLIRLEVILRGFSLISISESGISARFILSLDLIINESLSMKNLEGMVPKVTRDESVKIKVIITIAIIIVLFFIVMTFCEKQIYTNI
jgi:hypothetical protein